LYAFFKCKKSFHDSDWPLGDELDT
jgi:hypothetical protein